MRAWKEFQASSVLFRRRQSSAPVSSDIVHGGAVARWQHRKNIRCFRLVIDTRTTSLELIQQQDCFIHSLSPLSHKFDLLEEDNHHQTQTMKISIAAITAFLLAEQASAFVSPSQPFTSSSKTYMAMDVDMPPAAANVPVIQKSQYGPTDVRYSDFLKLVDSDKVEKVTFSADGSQLLGVDVDGTRVKIEALPNDPSLLNALTDHKVRRFRFVLQLSHDFS